MQIRRMTLCLFLAMVLCLGACGSKESPTEKAEQKQTEQPEENPAEKAVEKSTEKAENKTENRTTENINPKEKRVDISTIKDLPEGVSVSSDEHCIYQKGRVGKVRYSLTIDLHKWEGFTSLEQIGIISKLFWDCYPRMYERFGKVSDAARKVTIAVENEGYAPAETGGAFVHIHDKWLYENPEDYDCLTHELAHVIQNDWDGNYCEYSDYIERFADFCRYEYAYDNGSYNDRVWELQTVEQESDLATSNRFFVWLDYTYSTPSKDVLLEFFKVCFERSYESEDWNEAWKEIFSQTKLEGRRIDEVWTEYSQSDFASLYAVSDGQGSPLLDKYDIRGRLRNCKQIT